MVRSIDARWFAFVLALAPFAAAWAGGPRPQRPGGGTPAARAPASAVYGARADGTCVQGQVVCGFACVDVARDSANCGRCGNVCPVGQTCREGRCSAGTGSTWCNGRAADLATSEAHCGGCLRTCDEGLACRQSACVACPADAPLCNGDCRRLDTVFDCGACGRRCDAVTEMCQAGRCVPNERFDGGAYDVVQLAMHEDHGCALLSDGVVRCWGDSPAVGRPAGSTKKYVARTLRNQAGRALRSKQLVTGRAHSCALIHERDDLSYFCWGDTSLHRELNAPSGQSLRVPLPRVAVQMASGPSALCFLYDDGTVACRAADDYRPSLRGDLPLLSRGSSRREDVVDPATYPRPVPGIMHARAIAVGGTSSGPTPFQWACALHRNSSVRCWQISGAAVERPKQVRGLAGVAEIAMGGRTACARLTDGSVRCWGANDKGQLGDGTTVAKDAPGLVVGLQAKSLSVGNDHACAIRKDGEVACWGNRYANNCRDRLPAGHVLRPVEIGIGSYGVKGPMATGSARTCVRADHEFFVCWGGADLRNPSCPPAKTRTNWDE